MYNDKRKIYVRKYGMKFFGHTKKEAQENADRFERVQKLKDRKNVS